MHSLTQNFQLFKQNACGYLSSVRRVDEPGRGLSDTLGSLHVKALAMLLAQEVVILLAECSTVG